MKKLTIILTAFLFTGMFYSCEKEFDSIEDIEEENLPPEIISLIADETILESEENTEINCIAIDPEEKKLSYFWSLTGGYFGTGDENKINWEAPEVNYEQKFTITIEVEDEEGLSTKKSITLTVLPKEPEIFTKTLFLTDDACVASLWPDSNFGNEKYLSAGKIDGNSQEYFSYLKFDLSELPENISITKAELRMVVGYNSTDYKPPGDIYIFGVEDVYWSENSITYNNRPPIESNPITISPDILFSTSSAQYFDIKNHLISNIGVTNSYSLFIDVYFESDYVGYFYSKESGYGWGAIIVEYTVNQ